MLEQSNIEMLEELEEIKFTEKSGVKIMFRMHVFPNHHMAGDKNQIVKALKQMEAKVKNLLTSQYTVLLSVELNGLCKG